MSKHDHVPPKECEHDLKFCKPCIAVYCTKCPSEWVGPCTKAHSPEPFTFLRQYQEPPPRPWPGVVPVALTDAVSRTHVGHQ